MSWYLFRDSPAIPHRGIKVEGFQEMHRPRINLSWGMNQKTNIVEQSIVPVTASKPEIQKKQLQAIKNMKVLTQTSDDEEEELMKLIKQKQQSKPNIEYINNRTLSLKKPQSNYNSNKTQQRNTIESQFTKRMRYLQNSLLPNCRRDSMDTVFDHNLSKQVPLSDSRLSNRSNKKNQSSFTIGNGYNAFIGENETKKQLTKRLQQMYEYQDQYKKRVSQSNFVLG